MKNRVILKLIALALIPLLLVGLSCGLNRKDQGFSVHKISAQMNYEQDWDLPPLRFEQKQLVKQILSQKFEYLADGAQVYAFVSKDGKYILKFFKMRHLTPKLWLNYLPLPESLEDYRFRKLDKRILLRYETFNSYKQAFEELQKESGLLYVHLNPTREFKKSVLVVDDKGKEHKIDLDRVPFVIQKRAELLYVRLAKIKEKRDHAEMRYALHSFLELVALRCKKGFADKDKGISGNYGFVGDTVIQIDIGEMLHDDLLKEPSNVQREVLRVGKRLEYWIMHNAPEYTGDIQEEIKHFFD